MAVLDNQSNNICHIILKNDSFGEIQGLNEIVGSILFRKNFPDTEMRGDFCLEGDLIKFGVDFEPIC